MNDVYLDNFSKGMVSHRLRDLALRLNRCISVTFTNSRIDGNRTKRVWIYRWRRNCDQVPSNGLPADFVCGTFSVVDR